MKKIAFFLAFIMAVAAVAMPIGVAADNEPKFVPIFDFDTVTATSANYDAPTIDTGNHLNGDGCYTLKTDLNGAHPSVPLLEAKFNPVDISDCDYLCFWLWLESAELASKFTSGRIELNSSGVHNEKTDIWIATGNASAWPHSVIANMIEGGAKAGWNLVKIPLDTSKFAIYHDNADRTHINYFRLYGDNGALKNKTIKLDYMYAYQEGAAVPEPRKAEPEEPVVKDPVFVKIFDFDTVTATSANYDAPTIDTENHLNGDGCYTLKTDPNGAHPSVPLLEAKFDPVDISDCDYLCFWLWLESAELASKFTSGRIELNSSGMHNEKTDIWIATGNASAWPHSVIANMIEGGAKAGWNLVKIPLDSSRFAIYHDNADRTHINYFRLYGDNGALKNKTIKLDCMYAYTEGTEIPALKKNASPETQAPETQAPETQAPETQAPETQAPETQAPETQAPETQAPETQAPETQAPETQAPETQAPETQAPETQVPETQAPETQAPGTDVPVTQDPSTQPADDPQPVAFGMIAVIAAAAVAVIGAVFVIIKKKH